MKKVHGSFEWDDDSGSSAIVALPEDVWLAERRSSAIPRRRVLRSVCRRSRFASVTVQPCE